MLSQVLTVTHGVLYGRQRCLSLEAILLGLDQGCVERNGPLDERVNDLSSRPDAKIAKSPPRLKKLLPLAYQLLFQLVLLAREHVDNLTGRAFVGPFDKLEVRRQQRVDTPSHCLCQQSR